MQRVRVRVRKKPRKASRDWYENQRYEVRADSDYVCAPLGRRRGVIEVTRKWLR
jgi:hypothetical protein